MADDLAAEASAFLLRLAHGQYDSEVAAADRFLTALGPAVPWAIVVKQAMDTLVMINRITAPLQVVSDGRGGFVPATNSRINPKTGQFL